MPERKMRLPSDTELMNRLRNIDGTDHFAQHLHPRIIQELKKNRTTLNAPIIIACIMTAIKAYSARGYSLSSCAKSI
jgi:hypothetical protein